MQIQVGRLRRALSLLEPAVSSKGTLPALSHVRLGEGKAVATNLKVMVAVEMPEATDGPVLLPLGQALEFLRYTPRDVQVGVVARDGRVFLMSKQGQAGFDTKKADDYPPIPQVGQACPARWTAMSWSEASRRWWATRPPRSPGLS